jgi:hypothetical protein
MPKQYFTPERGQKLTNAAGKAQRTEVEKILQNNPNYLVSPTVVKHIDYLFEEAVQGHKYINKANQSKQNKNQATKKNIYKQLNATQSLLVRRLSPTSRVRHLIGLPLKGKGTPMQHGGTRKRRSTRQSRGRTLRR